MNRSISHLAFLGTLVVGQNNVEIPLRKTADDNFIANVSIPTAGVRYVDMKLSLGNTNTICHPSVVIGEPRQTLTLNSGSSPSYNFTDWSVLLDTYAASSYLAIGPDSALTQLTGAVAFIRNDDDNSAKLIVGSQGDTFESYCRPNTIFRVPMDDGDLIFESEFRFGAEYTAPNIHMRFGPTRNGILFWAPPSLVQNISRAIEANGGILGRSGGFHNCTQTTITSLPEIRITVGQREGHVGTLVYYPEDYIDLRDENRCTLRVQAVGGIVHFTINPLVLPSTNIRISVTNVWTLCDAADPIA